MTALIDLVNRALEKLGQEALVSLDQTSPYAAKVKRVWPGVLDSVLREHSWRSATRRLKLNRLAEAPLFGWDYRYQLPPDFVSLVQTHPANIQVEIEGDSILCNEKSLGLAYVARLDNPDLYDGALKECLVLKLAAELAYGTTASASLAQALEQQYREKLKDARHQNANESPTPGWQLGSWAQAKLGG